MAVQSERQNLPITLASLESRPRIRIAQSENDARYLLVIEAQRKVSSMLAIQVIYIRNAFRRKCWLL
jgi:hypothetical protein